MPRCPGQDQRFWKPDDIFEAACPHCGVSIEFWKDEPSLKCPECRKLVVNPKLDLGCATWCQHAEQCLGTLSDHDDILCKRLIREAKELFGRDERRVDRTLRIFRNAQEIMTTEEADPRLVNATAILNDVEDVSTCQAILFKCGLTPEVTEHICGMIAGHRTGGGADPIESRIVSDAIRLAELDSASHPKMEEIGAFVKRTFRTTKGRELAAELLRGHPPGDSLS